MKKIIFIISLNLFFSCGTGWRDTQERPIGEPKTIQTEEYELIIPSYTPNAVLILMGGNAEGIRKEFDIIDESLSNGIALMLMNINFILMEESDKEKLANTILDALGEQNLKSEKIFMGGLSVGGNMALLLGDYLAREKPHIGLSGIFVVDSPVDLFGVYTYAKKAMTKDLDAQSLLEAEELMGLFENQLGQGDTSLFHYDRYSPFQLRTKSIINLKSLKNTRMRFYTEPDTTWWRENLKTDFENTNAYHIKLLTDILQQEFGEQVEYIPTVNKGYRSDGIRTPHSWSIVDKNDLIRWVLKK